MPARPALAAGGRLALGSLALGGLALGSLALLALLALLGLGLDLDDRCGDVGDHGLVRVVEELDALDFGHVLEPERVADLHRADVGVDVLRHLHRQRLDVELAAGCERTPPSLTPGASSAPIR